MQVLGTGLGAIDNSITHYLVSGCMQFKGKERAGTLAPGHSSRAESNTSVCRHK